MSSQRFSSFIEKFRAIGIRNVVEIMLLAIAEVAVFGLSYFLTILLPQAHLYLHITESEVNTVIGVFGGVSLLSQIPAGLLADRFNNKYLVVIGLSLAIPFLMWFSILVHIGGKDIPYLFVQYILVCIFWGLATSLFFWSPMQKLIRQKVRKEDIGTAYAIQGTVNGIFGGIFIWAIGVLTIYLMEKFADQIYFAYYCYFTVFIIIVILLLVIFFVSAEEPSTPESRVVSEQSNTHTSWRENKLFLTVINPKVWALSLGVLAIVVYQSILAFYLKDVLSNVFKVAASVVAILAGTRYFVARALASPFGRFADRRRSYILCVSILLMAAACSLLPFVLLPGFSAQPALTLSPGYFKFLQWLLSISFLLTGLIAWMLVTIQFTQIIEVSRPPRSYATTLSFIALIGYSSRAWFMPSVGGAIDRYAFEYEGQIITPWPLYQVIIAATLAICFLASIILYIVYLSNKRELRLLGKTDFRWRDVDNY